MYGAIIGDLSGSIYEYDQFRKTQPISVKTLISHNSFFSDDTILTVAIADAILSHGDYKEYLRSYAKKYASYKPSFNPYFDGIFSPGFMKWANGNYQGTSHGNGAMMRISPVGYLFNSEQEVIENAALATSPSHNSKEAIEAATKVALMVFYLRNGIKKEKAMRMLKISPNYISFKRFNMTCEETFNNCMYVLSVSSSFDKAVINAVEMGGDTDTNAAIVGSMAEALYGIDNTIIEKATEKLPEEFIKILNDVYSKIDAGVV